MSASLPTKLFAIHPPVTTIYTIPNSTLKLAPPQDVDKHTFVFRYGSAGLSSTPEGATVLRNGKEAGKTPLKLDRLPAGETTVAIKLGGYVHTNISLFVVENQITNYMVKLLSEGYVEALNRARESFASGQYTEAQQSLTQALEFEPNDKLAEALRAKMLFRIKYRTAEDALSKDQFDEALKAVEEAETFATGLEDVEVFRERVNKQKLKRFETIIRDAEAGLSKGAIDEASRDLAYAQKLYPEDQRVARVQELMIPALRDKQWGQTVDSFRESPLSETYIWKYSKGLVAVRDGTIKATGEILSGWKLATEQRPDEKTVIITLKPKGMGTLAFPYTGVLMLSELEPGLVEMRSKFWVYAPQGNSVAGKHLRNVTWELSKCLSRKLGAPMDSRSLPP